MVKRCEGLLVAKKAIPLFTDVTWAAGGPRMVGGRLRAGGAIHAFAQMPAGRGGMRRISSRPPTSATRDLLLWQRRVTTGWHDHEFIGLGRRRPAHTASRTIRIRTTCRASPITITTSLFWIASRCAAMISSRTWQALDRRRWPSSTGSGAHHRPGATTGERPC